MIYLLSGQGRRALRALVNQSILYAFDFDGTLAPIRSDRSSAKMSRSVREWLKELAKRAPCAVVSGRELSDVVGRVDGTVSLIVGNHGIESAFTPTPALLSAETSCLQWKQELSRGIVNIINELGAEIEDKRYTLTVHFRNVEEPDRVKTALLPLLERLSPAPRLIVGRASINAVPSGEYGKGRSVEQIMNHLKRTGVLFIGDDETDEDVFALPGNVMGVRVGLHSRSHARFYLKCQDEVEQVIRFLVHRLDRTPESPDAHEEEKQNRRRAANDL
ncbi:trehalose-phosphatase [Petrachloros mirabilis]